VEVFINEFLVSPTLYEGGLPVLMRAAERNRLFRSGDWKRAVGAVGDDYGRIDAMLTEDKR
jgi:hypothetical protein